VYKVIKPIVPGLYDDKTKWVGEENHREVRNVGIVFDSFPDQDIYKRHPIYFVSEKFKTEYENSSLSGISKFTLIRSLLFENEEDPRDLDLNYLEIEVNQNVQDQDDFLRDRTKLLVSSNAVDFVNKLNCDGAEFETYDPDWHSKLIEKYRKKRDFDNSLIGKVAKWFK